MLLVVRAHPAHEIAVGRGRAEAVAEAALHDVIERARARRDVVVHHEAPEAVALDGEGPVALVLDQIPEDLVAQLAQLPHEVPGLAQAEQQGLGGKRPEERRDARAIERPGRVLDIHTFNGISEHSV